MVSFQSLCVFFPFLIVLWIYFVGKLSICESRWAQLETDIQSTWISTIYLCHLHSSFSSPTGQLDIFGGVFNIAMDQRTILLQKGKAHRQI